MTPQDGVVYMFFSVEECAFRHCSHYLGFIAALKPEPPLTPQDGVVYMFFSVSVEECAFQKRTHYGTVRWTPGGDVMMVQSADNGETWTKPRVGHGAGDGSRV